MDMKSALEGRIRRAEDIAAAFAHFKREVCLAAEHSKTGRPVGDKALAALEERGAQQLVEASRRSNAVTGRAAVID
jgi:hypothetical protein